MPAPELLTIEADRWSAKHVGRAADRRQFFLTQPFVPSGHEYLALYVFDDAGRLVEARIEDFGPRERAAEAARRATAESWLTEIGPVQRGRIEVAPFAVERDGVQFGLIAREFEGTWSVSVMPGDYMAFFEPWDSGDYDT